VAAASETEILAIIDSFEPTQAQALRKLRLALLKLVPGAEETIGWGMPTLRIGGVILLNYLGFKNHNSVFPGPEVAQRLGSALDGHQVTKGTIHFEKFGGFKPALLKRIVQTRIAVINEGYPKANGEFLEFYDNGFLKAKGRYRDGEMHGSWQFFRRDGSLMREGKLAAGQPVGEWKTHTREAAGG
jgi:uncharacterized protein YdhG (YjbR/CyaY superfamily)